MAQYTAISNKFGTEFEFNPFFVIEPVEGRDFRSHHVNLQDYTAVIFSSRHTIDAYFKFCEESRFKVPETMKYFCTTEHIAMYLQKHIVYRKRKIFYGDGTTAGMVSLIGPKHSGEKFLVTTSEGASTEGISKLLEAKGVNFTIIPLVKSVSRDLRSLDLDQYSMFVLYNQADLVSLKENFPDKDLSSLKFLAYGKTVLKALEAEGLKATVTGPTEQAPSAAKAIELYLETL